MHAALRKRAAEFGLEVGELKHLSNTRPALVATEFARDHGRHRELSREVFAAYFARGEDIGDANVLSAITVSCDLDPVELGAALADDRYADRLDEHARAAALAGVSAVPTFIVGAGSGFADTHGAPGRLASSADAPGGRRIVGAQPLEAFRRVLRELGG